MSTTMQSTTHSATAPTQMQIREALVRVMYIGLALSLGLAMVFLLVGFLLRQGGAMEAAAPTRENRVMFYALLFVAVSEVPLALFLKKIFLKPLAESGGAAVPTTSFIQSRYLVLFNLAAACPCYGFVWYLMGGTLPEFALFAVIGLLIFRLVRPSAEFFFSLFGVRPAIE